jgi:hypothetical protein
MREVVAATLDSVLLLNRGGYFEARPLPLEAQLSPVFGLAIGDLDGDGDEDLFLAQNFFGVAPTESRHDSGCGLWLRGDGRGGFVAVLPGESGFAIEGEGRGAALRGSTENPQAVGAVVRVAFRGGKLGPAREIRLGGGYWSQDSSEIVLGLPEEPETLGIQWPDGATERVNVPAGVRAVSPVESR